MERSYRYAGKEAIYWIIISALLMAGCATKNPNLVTAEEKAAARNTEIVARVGRLQSTAIQAAKDKSITEDVADRVVTWTVETNKILKTNPVDGLAYLEKGWPAIKAEISKYQVFLTIIPTIDEILREATR